MIHKRPCRYVSSAVLALTSAGSTSVLAEVTFTKLGGLPGTRSGGLALCISPDGRIVGGLSFVDGKAPEAVVWRDGVISTLPSTPTGKLNSTEDMSADGRLFVGSTGEGSNRIGYLVRDGQFANLGNASNRLYGVSPQVVSADGTTIAGRGWSPYVSNSQVGWYWRNGTIQILPDLASNTGGWTNIHCISADGSMIGGSSPSERSVGEPTVWINGVPRSLGLDGDRFGSGTILDATPDFSVVVGYYVDPVIRSSRPTIWRDGSFSIFDPLPGFDGALIQAISPDASFYFGLSRSNGSKPVLTLWSHDGRAASLPQIFQNASVMPEGWRLESITAVAADGVTIAGWATDELGVGQAWMATIPAPASLVVLAVGLVFSRTRRSEYRATQQQLKK